MLNKFPLGLALGLMIGIFIGFYTYEKYSDDLSVFYYQGKPQEEPVDYVTRGKLNDELNNRFGGFETEMAIKLCELEGGKFVHEKLDGGNYSIKLAHCLFNGVEYYQKGLDWVNLKESKL